MVVVVVEVIEVIFCSDFSHGQCTDAARDGVVTTFWNAIRGSKTSINLQDTLNFWERYDTNRMIFLLQSKFFYTEKHFNQRLISAYISRFENHSHFNFGKSEGMRHSIINGGKIC